MSDMGCLPCTTAILRFPRRNPLVLLVLLIPLALYIYAYHEPFSSWRKSPELNLEDLETHVPFIPPVDSPGKSDTLLVTAFFPLSTSAKSIRSSQVLLKNFLSRVTTEVYMYTTPDFESTISSLRGSLPITINATFESPFDIPPLQGLEEQYKEMSKLRHTRKSLDMFAVTNGRPYYVAEALRSRQGIGREYQYTFWVDALDFEDSGHAYRQWPSSSRIAAVWDEARRDSGSRKEDIIFVPISNLPHVSMLLWKEDMGPIKNEFSQGSIFGGSPKAMLWWEKYFYAYHAFWLSRRDFVLDYEAILNGLLILRGERFFTVWPGDPKAPAASRAAVKDVAPNKAVPNILGKCGDERTYYQFWLASEAEQTAMQQRWDAEWHWDAVLNWWRGQSQGPCRTIRLLAIEWLLRRPFGEMWRAPDSTVPF